MSRDDILQAIRLTAMGRAGHPLQEQLADELAGLLATPEQRAEADMAFTRSEIVANGPAVVETPYTFEQAPVVIEDQRKAKRKKAD